MVTKGNKQAFAEVIESSLQGWTGQSWKWNTFPRFGSLTIIENSTRIWFGIVYQVQTGSNDPNRSPFIYQKTETELLAEQPQIFEFLKTSFSCLTVGFMERERITYQWAPEPPNIHAFIQNCSTSLSRQFFSSTQYLPLLFNHPLLSQVDELLLAIITEQKRLDIFSDDKLYELMETVSLLTGNDYRRLKILSSRLL